MIGPDPSSVVTGTRDGKRPPFADANGAAGRAPSHDAGTSWSWLPVGAITLLALPLAAVLIRFRYIPWSPILDNAWTELRVRDVGTLDTPLVGLPGRIGTFPNLGSHPGPLSFYLLAPVYRLLGSTAWALQASSAVLQVVWITAAVTIARRRGGPSLVAGIAAVLATLMTGYGFNVLTEPWNPYLPVLPWFVFLLALWSVLCDDTAMLPVAALAGTFCAQTHVPYLPLTTGLGALVSTVVCLRTFRGGDRYPRLRRHVLIALAIGVIAWMPPILDQLIHTPGNLGVLLTYFTHPTEQTVGLRAGLDLALERLDLFHFAVDQLATPGTFVQLSAGHEPSRTRGMLVVFVWIVSLAAASLMRERRLLNLHAIVGAALLLAIVVLGRIFGMPWYYLMLWMWGVAALTALTIGWTAAAVAARFLTAPRWPNLPAILTTVLLLWTATFAVRFSAAAVTTTHWSTLGDVIPPLAATSARALAERLGEVPGRDRRYLVLWSDTMNGGAQGFGFLNELERLGLYVGVPESYATLATPHRVLAPHDADAGIVLANGKFIDRYRADRRAVEVAFVDPRSPEERREYETVRATVLSELRAAKMPGAARDLDANLFGAALTPGISVTAQHGMARLLQIGTASAVFVVPSDFQLPFFP